MLFTTIAAAAAFSATASAYTGIKSDWYNSTCNPDKPRARIVNNCPYTVYAWTVDSDDPNYDCKFQEGLTLRQGQFYHENFRSADNGAISIKLLKTKHCDHDGSTLQLEYNPAADGHNYLDVSYINCLNKDCPTAANGEGWKLVSGNYPDGRFKNAGADKAICPLLECGGFADCEKKGYAYFRPNDVQTRSCPVEANLDYYLCNDEESNAPPHSEISALPEPSKPSKPEPTEEAPAATQDSYPEAPVVTAAPVEKKVGHVKTVYEYKTVHVNEHRRRHAHAHYHS